jgi:3-deoxy-D-manno-octulosonic acid kinase
MDASTASGSRQSFRDAGGQGTIVFDPVHLRQAEPELFDPASYGLRAQPVQAMGGRGAAWFVQGSFGDAVLRRYRRGGWMARASGDAYLWQGEPRVRSLREFALMQRLHALALPVPSPVAAYYRREGLRYRAAILVERIARATPFANRVCPDPGLAPWATVGAAIGRCHRLGARHADLNANNILLDAAGGAWIIDWDKGRMEPAPGEWCHRVLERLRRSLYKECRQVDRAAIDAGMRVLIEAHDRELAP